MPGETILIVDDHPTNLKLARVLFAAEGYDVHTAGSATEALGVLSALRPHLILMDLLLPDTHGLELTRRLKADPGTRDIPIVALTAFAMKGDDERALQAGCDGYVSKPIDTRALVSVVAKHLGKK
jgi:CheY-like chemotaxis protein